MNKLQHIVQKTKLAWTCRHLGRTLVVPFKGEYIINAIFNNEVYSCDRTYIQEGIEFREKISVNKKDFYKFGIKIVGKKNDEQEATPREN